LNNLEARVHHFKGTVRIDKMKSKYSLVELC